MALDLGDDCADGDRRFDYILTYDRDLVAAAGMRLMRHLLPVDPSAARQETDGATSLAW